MAPASDPLKNAQLVQFVEALAARAGYAGHAEWARDSGYPAPNLSKLRNGVASIDGFNLLRLIKAAAKRAGVDEAGITLSAAGDAQADAIRELERRLERRLEEVSDLTAENFEIVKDQLAAVARRLPPEGEQDRTEEAQ